MGVLLYIHITNVRTFYDFKKEPSTLNYCTLIFLSLPIPRPYATTGLLLVSIDLAILNMSYEWNHIIYVLCVCVYMRLAFTYQIVFPNLSFLALSCVAQCIEC